MISFGRHICNDFRIATEKEWLFANHKGSYACSTILMANTRKHHGLLVAKFPGIDNRIVVFPTVDEEVEISGHIYHLSTHKYKKTVYPKGYALLENFTIKDGMVTMLYLIDNIRVRKEIYLMKDKNTTVLTYTILTPDSHAKLRVKPLIAFRESEHLVKEMPIFDPEVKVVTQQKIQIHAYMNFPAAYIYNPDEGEIKLEGVWYRDFFYMRDDQSGFDASEDLYNVCTIELDMEYNKPRSVIFSTENYEEISGKALWREFKEQVKVVNDICVKTGACVKDDDYRQNVLQLLSAAESFVIYDQEEVPYVVAGYQWPHHIWFRDMLASVPGLFLIQQKFRDARMLLENVINFERNGLLPLNMTIDKNDVKYSSVDTTLWLFYALYKYLEYTRDFNLVKRDSEAFKRLTWIIQKHIDGTDFNIHKDTDDLLYAGFPGLQLTWMDTKVGGNPVTPRQGKPVEINALWYNAIRTMEFICSNNGSKDMVKSYKALADSIYKNFNEKFWNEEGGYLYDFIDAGYREASVRPNQLPAISLPFELIDEQDKKEKIMNTIIKELYTSFGLRSLSNMNVNFKAHYDGDQNARDAAAHQGTVWGFLAGSFVTGYLKTFGKAKESMKFIETVYEPIFEHLKTAGLGTVSEMFDGSFPYTARGRISHAWAVAEILRSYFEDYSDNGPKAKK